MFVMRLQVGLFHTQHVSILELLSDILTKALGKSQFLYLMPPKFGNYDSHVPI